MGRLKAIKKKRGTILGVTGCIASLKREYSRQDPLYRFCSWSFQHPQNHKAVEEATKGLPFF